jgi:hypothetical protein
MTLTEALLISIVGLLCVLNTTLLVVDFRVREAFNELTSEVRELRLRSRTRITQAAVRTGPITEEAQLTRLGHASAARRVVVGGEDEAPQKQRLIKQTRVGGDSEEEGE